MYSIKINEDIIVETKLVNINKLKCHEAVVQDRKNSLKEYLKSLSPDILISSVIVCNKTQMIVDGHHRFSALKELGVSLIPVTYINYDSDYIKTHIDDSITKNEILSACESNNLLLPKSSKHMIFDFNTNTWKPIILISTLFQISID
jgi:hypothetical protein